MIQEGGISGSVRGRGGNIVSASWGAEETHRCSTSSSHGDAGTELIEEKLQRRELDATEITKGADGCRGKGRRMMSSDDPEEAQKVIMEDTKRGDDEGKKEELLDGVVRAVFDRLGGKAGRESVRLPLPESIEMYRWIASSRVGNGDVAHDGSELTHRESHGDISLVSCILVRGDLSGVIRARDATLKRDVLEVVGEGVVTLGSRAAKPRWTTELVMAMGVEGSVAGTGDGRVWEGRRGKSKDEGYEGDEMVFGEGVVCA